MLSQILRIIPKFLRRNQIILSDLTRTTVAHRVNLHWWSPPGDEQNVGDYLSTVIVEHVKRDLGIDDSGTLKRKQHLYAIGSIIDGGYQNATVWGSGILSGNRKFWWRKIRKLDIRAVRGPETRRTLMENGYSCPEIYGDPAILLPLFYTPKSAERKYEYRVIQNHMLSQEHEKGLSPITDDWKGFVDEIANSQLIISSSLHGIILAEAYGIPAIMLGTRLDLFKFNDYYHSTGRYDFPIAHSIEEALQMEPAPLPDLTELRKGLLNSFPADLWTNT